MLFPPSRRAPRESSLRRRISFRPRIDDLEARIVQSVYLLPNQPAWSNPSSVSYSFVPDGTSWGVAGGSSGGGTATTGTSNLDAALTPAFGSTEGWRMQIRQALATWSAATNINFYEVSETSTAYPEGSSPPTPSNNAVGDIRIGGFRFGSAGPNILAQTYGPGSGIGGDLNFNTDWIFTNGGASNTIDLQTVTLHELGHALGLAHNPSDPSAVMAPTYAGVRQTLTTDDLQSVRYNYGGARNLAANPAPATLGGAPLFISYSTTDASLTYTQFGNSTLDMPAVADYNNDGVDDKAVYRPSTGQWFILFSGSNTQGIHTFGTNQDQPDPGDYDGDSIKDFAVYNRSTGAFRYISSATGSLTTVAFGNPGQHVAVRGNFDGVGTDELAVFEPATANWYIRYSATNVVVRQWGLPGDEPVPGDYDGDGKTDLAVWRPATNQWFATLSTGGNVGYTFGNRGYDIPLAANFTGNSRAELVIWRVSSANYPVGSPTGSVAARSAASTSSTSTASGAASTPADSSYVLVPLPDATTEPTPAPVKSTRTPKGPRDFAPRWAALV